MNENDESENWKKDEPEAEAPELPIEVVRGIVQRRFHLEEDEIGVLFPTDEKLREALAAYEAIHAKQIDANAGDEGEEDDTPLPGEYKEEGKLLVAARDKAKRDALDQAKRVKIAEDLHASGNSEVTVDDIQREQKALSELLKELQEL